MEGGYTTGPPAYTTGPNAYGPVLPGDKEHPPVAEKDLPYLYKTPDELPPSVWNRMRD